eukprot:scaffold973_cov126-Skeletonema_marinoi.AAC.4
MGIDWTKLWGSRGRRVLLVQMLQNIDAGGLLMETFRAFVGFWGRQSRVRDSVASFSKWNFMARLRMGSLRALLY